MNYLVDTNVLCEPRQKHPELKVVKWLKSNESSLYTSVLVTGEIRYGIELLPASSSRRADLLRWYEGLLKIMSGRILSINARVTEEWARLQAEAHAKKLVLPIVDSLLATAARRLSLSFHAEGWGEEVRLVPRGEREFSRGSRRIADRLSQSHVAAVGRLTKALRTKKLLACVRVQRQPYANRHH